ncbi:hypothetical protein MNBD_GAMMA07-426 [hydrothermal vent metagenome]|uniref:Response regulatory domain-containing protein n=1 Tax=hydrothermal vent metagenome TaxID=652676 RepID=A0A3B0XJF4_9ZZZZ
MSNPIRLMIVDDSKVSRMMIKSIVLNKSPDIEIYEAADGQSALDQAEGKSIDYFSVDYNMPIMDGIEFITKMRQHDSQAKFALLTANIQEATHKKADEIGAKCINKPINEACINTLLEYFNG